MSGARAHGNRAGAGDDPGRWRPRHGTRDRAEDVVWLPRLIDKGRRVLAGEAVGRDLMGDYHFGVHDAADAQLLRFLRLANDDVLAILRAEPDDARAAAQLVRRSGRSQAECVAWSARFSRLNAPFNAMIDADEGRRAPGLSTTALRFAYNRVLMPPVYPLYRLLERRRLARAAGGSSGRQRAIGGTRWLPAAAVALGLGLALAVGRTARRRHERVQPAVGGG